jgi:hypothetical protein
VGIHSQLDYLQGNLAGDRLCLFGQKYHTHSALTEKADQAVRADLLSGSGHVGRRERGRWL